MSVQQRKTSPIQCLNVYLQWTELLTGNTGYAFQALLSLCIGYTNNINVIKFSITAGGKEKRISIILFYWNHLRHHTCRRNNTLNWALLTREIQWCFTKEVFCHLHMGYHYWTKNCCSFIFSCIFFVPYSDNFNRKKIMEPCHTIFQRPAGPSSFSRSPTAGLYLFLSQQGLGLGPVLETMGALLLCSVSQPGLCIYLISPAIVGI